MSKGRMTSRLGGDRRAIFLVVAGVICLFLRTLTPDELTYVPVLLFVWCVVLALLSWLDHFSRQHQRP